MKAPKVEVLDKDGVPVVKKARRWLSGMLLGLILVIIAGLYTPIYPAMVISDSLTDAISAVVIESAPSATIALKFRVTDRSLADFRSTTRAMFQKNYPIGNLWTVLTIGPKEADLIVSQYKTSLYENGSAFVRNLF